METFKEACIFDLGYFAHNVEEEEIELSRAGNSLYMGSSAWPHF